MIKTTVGKYMKMYNLGKLLFASKFKTIFFEDFSSFCRYQRHYVQFSRFYWHFEILNRKTVKFQFHQVLPKLYEKQKSFINSLLFCSEFQSVSRIMKFIHSERGLGSEEKGCMQNLEMFSIYKSEGIFFREIGFVNSAIFGMLPF